MRALRILPLSLGLMIAGCASAVESQGDATSVRDLLALEEAIWDNAEELTATCMREQGFRYQPRPFPSETLVLRPGLSEDLSDGVFDLRLLTLDQASESGFGIVDGMFGERGRQHSQPVDPNTRILEELSDVEASAWTTALHGNPVTGTSGCRESAEEQARADEPDFVALQRQLVAFGEAIEADARYVSLQEDLSHCLADRGIDPPDIDELQFGLQRKAGDLLQTAAETSSMPDLQAVAALRDREVELATDAARCAEPLQPLLDEIAADAKTATE